MNPYYACTWNKMVDSILCVNGKAIDKLMHDLNKKFKTKFNKLSVCKGKVHSYLGINIDYMNTIDMNICFINTSLTPLFSQMNN